MCFKYSIVIPVYNGRKYLLNNIFKNDSEEVWGGIFLNNPNNIPYEVIFVNDGSVDDSEEIIKKYLTQFNFIKLISRQNKGNLVSRLEGAKIAQGDYILFFDQDDYYHKDLIQELEKVREKYNPDIISFRYHSTDGNIIFHESKLNYPNTLLLDRNIFMKENVTTMWNKAFKKDLVLKANIDWNNPYAFDEDRNLVSILRSEATSEYELDKNLYQWFIHNSGLHNLTQERITSFIDYRFQKFCLDHISNKVNEDVFMMELEYASGHCYEGIVLVSTNKSLTLRQKRQLFKTIRRSECFKVYLKKILFSRRYICKFGLKNRTVIFLFRFKLYFLLSVLGIVYQSIKH